MHNHETKRDVSNETCLKVITKAINRFRHISQRLALKRTRLYERNLMNYHPSCFWKCVYLTLVIYLSGLLHLLNNEKIGKHAKQNSIYPACVPINAVTV